MEAYKYGIIWIVFTDFVGQAPVAYIGKDGPGLVSIQFQVE